MGCFPGCDLDEQVKEFTRLRFDNFAHLPYLIDRVLVNPLWKDEVRTILSIEEADERQDGVHFAFVEVDIGTGYEFTTEPGVPACYVQV